MLLIGVCFHAKAQTYKPVRDKSVITFTVKNFGLNVDGTFSQLKGTIQFDPLALPNSSFDVSIESPSLDTGIDLRDKHLKKKDYLDVSRYTLLSFKSTSVAPGEKSGSYAVTGNLTIKDVTKEVQFPFTATVTGDGIAFVGKFKINRRDYNVGGKSISMGDTVDVQLEVFASKASTISTGSK
jgi:polyisoprenoid-binding protein YceI